MVTRKCRFPRHPTFTSLLHTTPALLVVVLFASTVLLPAAQAQTVGPCGIANPAFCDEFDSPSPNNGSERRGQLAPIWGVSRVTGNTNLNQGYDNAWADTHIRLCDGSMPVVHPPMDVQICNGQVREAINDTGMNDLAMYPRQPFDIAGRTGIVAFDVSDDSAGSHSAWPEFSFTDQPIPAPSPSQIAFPGALLARNSLSIAFSGFDGTCTFPGESWITTNYQMQELSVVKDGCVLPPAQNSFTLNHVEIRMSQSGWEVWMSDAGTRNLKKVSHSTFTMPLTRGLVWMKDAHYNGDKPCHEGWSPICQGEHTFAWDNFGFDGPVLTRDLGIELPDNQTVVGSAENGLPTRMLGQTFNAAINKTSATLNFSGVYALSNVEKASAALFEMAYYSQSQAQFRYSVNGGPLHTQDWPSNSVPTWSEETIALPVPVSELHNGDNSIVFSTSVGLFGFSNVDLILVNAGDPGPPTTPAPTNTPVPAATATPPPAATATSVPSTPVPATATPSGRQFNRTLQRGDSIQVTCSGGTLTLASQSQTSDVLVCN